MTKCFWHLRLPPSLLVIFERLQYPSNIQQLNGKRAKLHDWHVAYLCQFNLLEKDLLLTFFLKTFILLLPSLFHFLKTSFWLFSSETPKPLLDFSSQFLLHQECNKKCVNLVLVGWLLKHTIAILGTKKDSLFLPYIHFHFQRPSVWLLLFDNYKLIISHCSFFEILLIRK